MKVTRIIFLLFTIVLLVGCAGQTAVKGEIYVYESNSDGFNTRTVFYDTGSEVVAIDAQFTNALAQESIDFLATKTDSPITYLVVTHPNPDKFNGIAAYKEAGATVIMSEATQLHLEAVHAYKQYYFVEVAGMFTAETYPALQQPDEVFADEYVITFANGDEVRLVELGVRGISTNQTIVEIPAAAALVVGDLVHHGVHAWLEGPIVEGEAHYNTADWVAALQMIQAQFDETYTVYGGRGEAAPLNEAIESQVAYLQTAERITQDYVNSLDGATLEEKKSQVDYEVLTALFEAEFPDYAHGYMITFGAYGLVAALH